MAVPYKRRNYFIDKSFQLRFILKFCLLIIAAGLLTMGALYLFARHSMTVSIVNSRVVAFTTADFILPLLIQTILVVTILIGIATAVVTLFISHKIAGPLYRFKKVVDNLSDGDFSEGFSIRKSDQLQELSSALNTMIAKVRSELLRLQKNIFMLKNMAEGSSSIELKKVTEELNKIIQRFKI